MSILIKLMYTGETQVFNANVYVCIIQEIFHPMNCVKDKNQICSGVTKPSRLLHSSNQSIVAFNAWSSA